MGTESLRVLLLVSVLAAGVNAQEPEPETTDAPRVGIFKAPTAADPTPDIRFATEDSTWWGDAKAWAYAVFEWFMEPIAKLMLYFLDGVGLTGQTVEYIDFYNGTAGYFFSAIDMWIPLHEACYNASFFIVVLAFWIPIRIVFKLIPGVW